MTPAVARVTRATMRRPDRLVTLVLGRTPAYASGKATAPALIPTSGMVAEALDDGYVRMRRSSRHLSAGRIRSINSWPSSRRCLPIGAAVLPLTVLSPSLLQQLRRPRPGIVGFLLLPGPHPGHRSRSAGRLAASIARRTRWGQCRPWDGGRFGADRGLGADAFPGAARLDRGVSRPRASADLWRRVDFRGRPAGPWAQRLAAELRRTVPPLRVDAGGGVDRKPCCC